jgi:hypothetical protein
MHKVADWLDEATALILVVGCLVLLGLGLDSEVKSILTIAAGYAFGTGVLRIKRKI